MVGLGTRGRGRMALAAWMCWLAVVRVAADSKNEVKLYRGSPNCKLTDSTLNCIATDDKTYKLDDSSSKGIEKVIINNAPVLVIEDPLCSNNSQREVVVHNSTRVITEPGSTNCSQQIVVHDSENVRLIDGVDLVRLVNSKADEINLPAVRQFDLTNSVVKQVSVRVYGVQSIVADSVIEDVKVLEVEGDFKFKVEDSTLEMIKGFKYNSPKEAIFRNTMLSSVSGNGFVVHQGTVRLEDCSIGKIEPLGLAVKGGKLDIVNSVLHSVTIDSIVVSEGGSVLLKNVTVANKDGVSFSVSNGTMNLYVLALLWNLSSLHFGGWVSLYVIIGMVSGMLVGAIIMHYIQKRRGVARTAMDMTKLLNKELIPPSQSDERLPKPRNNNNDDSNKKTQAAPHRPLPSPPEDTDVYEEYSDVSSQPQPDPPPHRPPVPTPDESSFTGGSTLPMTPTPPNWKYTEPKRNDDRDNLPPPPPPDDIYDDLAELPLSTCTKPRPPNPPTKTQGLPKKTPLPPPPLRKY